MLELELQEQVSEPATPTPKRSPPSCSDAAVASQVEPSPAKSFDDAASIAGDSVAGISCKRGRRKKTGPRPCGICIDGSELDDPVQLVLNPELKLAMRWAYPPIDGVPQGGFCWYCTTAVSMHALYVGMTCTQVKAKCDASPADRLQAKKVKATVAQLAIENGGTVTKSALNNRDVQHIQTHCS